MNLNLIREWLKEWTNKPPVLEIKVRRKKSATLRNKLNNKKNIEKNKEKIQENQDLLKNEIDYENIQKAASKQRLEY